MIYLTKVVQLTKSIIYLSLSLFSENTLYIYTRTHTHTHIPTHIHTHTHARTHIFIYTEWFKSSETPISETISEIIGPIGKYFRQNRQCS